MNPVVEALSFLTPFDVDKKKVRIGPEADGGYIFLDDFSPDQATISYGIGTEYRFDEEMARRGHDVYMFDHTIQGISASHEKMKFFREGVAGISEPDKQLWSIEDHLKRHEIQGDRLILKMDVEGAELKAIGMTSDAVIKRFDQIVVEVHDLVRLNRADYRELLCAMLRKLNKFHTLFHVHANNSDGPDGISIVSGIPVSNLLELSYALTTTLQRYRSKTLYPTALDFPNTSQKDKLLWFYPFLPTGLSFEDYAICEERVDCQVKSRRPFRERELKMQTSKFHQGILYIDFLKQIHQVRVPSSYLEIGVETGATLALARCRAVAIDPKFDFRGDIFGGRTETYLFQLTSDDFFSRYDLKRFLPHGVDFAFLDGMHHLEYLLRDLINVERYSRGNTIVALHDCYPVNHEIAERERTLDHRADEATRLWWAGDVWKLLPTLRDFRPDLHVTVLDCPPTGLVIVRDLNSDSKVLAEAYHEVVAKYRDVDLASFGIERFREEFPTVNSRNFFEHESMLRFFQTTANQTDDGPGIAQELSSRSSITAASDEATFSNRHDLAVLSSPKTPRKSGDPHPPNKRTRGALPARGKT